MMEVWEGFLSLNSSRIITNSGVHPISYTEIESWLNINGIRGETRQEYAHIIRVLDRTFLEELKSDARVRCSDKCVTS